jgi:hypothetical protein
MDDIRAKPAKKRKLKVSARETTLRLHAVRQAQANTRIEGISSSTDTKPVFDAFVRGEIDVHEIVPHLKLLQKLP